MFPKSKSNELFTGCFIQKVFLSWFFCFAPCSCIDNISRWMSGNVLDLSLALISTLVLIRALKGHDGKNVMISRRNHERWEGRVGGGEWGGGEEGGCRRDRPV